MKHVDTYTYPLWATFGAGVLLIMLLLQIVYGGIRVVNVSVVKISEYLPGKLIAAVPEGESTGLSDRVPDEETDDIEAEGGAEAYVFTSAWEPKDDNSKINLDGSLSLKESETSSIYEYGGVVPLRSDFGFSFVSRGVFGPNVVIGRPSFYEITVGDRSDNVITLKATDKLGGNLLPMEEAGWAKYKESDNALRPRTESCRFISGEEIKVDIVESFIESTSQFKVDVTVTCNDKKSDTFSWIFTPPPKWAENESLYFAIIDDSEGSNATKVDFLDPIVIEVSENPQ